MRGNPGTNTERPSSFQRQTQNAGFGKNVLFELWISIYVLTKPRIDSDLRFCLLFTQTKAPCRIFSRKEISTTCCVLSYPSLLASHKSSYLRNSFPKFVRNNPTDPELITDHGLRRLREGEIQAAVTVTSLSQSEGRNSQLAGGFTK